MSAEVVLRDERQEVSILSLIEATVNNPNLKIENIEALVNLQIRTQDREAQRSYNRAMIACQRAMRPLVNNALNPQTQSKYMKYDAMDRLLRPTYTDHGFVLTFGSRESSDHKYITITCKCLHEDGHSEDHELSGPNDSVGIKGNSNKTEMHGVGSAVSYLKRYLLKMIFNVITTDEGKSDNDGNGPVNVLSNEQAAKLEDLMSACEFDDAARKRFLTFMGVERLGDIPERLFVNAHENMKAKHRAFLKEREGK